MVTVTIHGTNDVPVITSNAITQQIDQGSSSLEVHSLFTAHATDVDATDVLTYSLVDARGYFTIDSATGAIGLTHSGAAAIAVDPVGDWKLNVEVNDGNGGIVEKTITVDVKMAVANDGATANLPGSVSDWTFRPASVTSANVTAAATDGFLLTRLDDPSIEVKIPHSVTELSFDNATVALDNNGKIGAVTVVGSIGGSEATHTITIGTDATGNASVVLAANSNITVQGAADSFTDKDFGQQDNVRSDRVVIDADASSAHFSTSADNKHITMTIDGGGQVILSEVEAVQFNDHTVRIVGANGYATVAEAQFNADAGDTVYVAPLRVANDVTALTGAVIEDGTGTTASVSGTLSVALANVAGVGPAAWSVVGASSSDFGSLTVDASTGQWTYNIDNTSTKVQALNAGADQSDSFVIRAQDQHGAFVDQTITVHVTGVNDGATVSSVTTPAIEEGNTAAALNTSGKLTIADADTGEALVVAQDVEGTYGTFHVASNGAWTYTGNGAHDELTAGQQVSDSITVKSADGTGSGTIKVNITGTNDLATVSSATTAVTESNDASSLSASGQLAITDADAGQVHVVAQSVAGTYGTIAVDADGKWTFTANGAHNELTAGQAVSQSLTVTSQDGTASGVITVNITGTNDAPVLSAATKTVSVTQGVLSTADVSAQIAATDVDGATSAITYGLVENTNLFSINATTGVISLTNVGAETISGLSGSGTTAGAYTLHVQATDANGGVSSSETVTVNVNMAVQAGGTSAILTGSMSDWSIAGSASTSGGYVMTNLHDPLVKVSLPGDVTQLNFTSGDSVALSNNGTIGNISYNPGTASGTHTIVIANSLENSLITLGTATSATVEGMAGSAKTEGIQIHQNVDVSNLNAVFDTISANHLTMHTTSGTVVMQNVEYVHFDNANVLIVGAGGYSSLATASAAAKSGDVIYVSDSSLADGATNGVINNHADISIYIANGDGANMSLANADQTVRIYGNHSFNLTGTAGADTVHDYTTLSAGMTNNIYGMDGADKLVSHSADLGTHVMSGGAGADVLIGGTGAQLLGGDGNDTLLAFGGAAILSGGAGDDILLNAYGNAAGTAAVNMTGGSGSDTFGLIGSDNVAQSGTMKTVVTDLGTGDKIDLSFIEIQGQNKSIDTAADFVAGSTLNKATMTTAGTTLAFDSNTMIATSSEADTGDTDTQLHAGSMVLSNATLTKASAAINLGHDTLNTSVVDFHTSFTPLTDTYNHHG